MAFVRMNGGSNNFKLLCSGDSNQLYTGNQVLNNKFLGTEVPNYANGNNTSELTFIKKCTLKIFIGTGRVYYGGDTSSITIKKNNVSIETLNYTTAPNWTSKSVDLEMDIGDKLKIVTQGTATGYDIHVWCIYVSD